MEPNYSTDKMNNPKKITASGATPRVIKKYPNRRLYDTTTSSYITLAQVKQLVMDAEVFVVKDAKSGADLTRTVLLQIILEEEAHETPIFTAPVLANVIRFYGHAMQGFVGEYLEKNMQSLTDMQAALGEQMQGLAPQTWAQLMAPQSGMLQTMVAQNLAQSQSLLAHMQKQATHVLGTLGIPPQAQPEDHEK